MELKTHSEQKPGGLNIGLFNIDKSCLNLGREQTDCYLRFAVIAGTERTRIILYLISYPTHHVGYS